MHIQAAAKDALAKALQADVSEEEPVEHQAESDQESEEDTGIGFKKAGSNQDKTKRRRVTKTEEATESTVPEAKPKPSAASGSKRKATTTSGPSSDLAESLKAANACLGALQSFMPLNYFQGSLKARDVDKKLNLAFQTQSALEEHIPTSPEAQNVGEQLSDAAKMVTNWMDIMVPFADSDGCLRHVRSMDPEDITKFATQIPADCTHAVLVDVGKRLWEENVGSGEECCAPIYIYIYIIYIYIYMIRYKLN